MTTESYERALEILSEEKVRLEERFLDVQRDLEFISSQLEDYKRKEKVYLNTLRSLKRRYRATRRKLGVHYKRAALVTRILG